MTNQEFTETFPPKLYDAVPALALFNPFCRDATLDVIRMVAGHNPQMLIGEVLDLLCTEAGVLYVAAAIFECLNEEVFPDDDEDA